MVCQKRSSGVCWICGLALLVAPASSAVQAIEPDSNSKSACCGPGAAVDKGLIDDARDVIDIIRDVRDLLKNKKSGLVTGLHIAKKSLPFDPDEVREMIGLIREVRDLVNEVRKSDKRVFVPDLSDLILTTGPIYARLKATKEFQAEKFGLAEVAAAVALAREIRELTKNKSINKIGFVEIAAAVAIAREVRDLLKAVPIDESKGIRVNVGVGVEIKSGKKTWTDLYQSPARKTTIDSTVLPTWASASAVFGELKRRETKTVSQLPRRQKLLSEFAALDRLSGFKHHTDVLPLEFVPASLRLLPIDILMAKLEADRKGVYGPDDRRDVNEWRRLRNKAVAEGRSTRLHDGFLRNARAVCCIVNKSQVHNVPGADAYQIDVGKFNVCAEEPFAHQPVVSFCSGFLVAKNVIATAGHCVESDEDALNHVYVFGFEVPDSGHLGNDERLVVASENVYFAEKLIKRKLDDETMSDFAVVKLDRDVVGRRPTVLSTKPVKKDERVYTIGHPCGLPMKVANNAVVRGTSDRVFFTANLDTYGGNSGSAVWREDSHEVVGILVRGGKDFRYLSVSSEVDGGLCRRSVYVGDADGRGEDVTRVDEFLSAVEQYLGH